MIAEPTGNDRLALWLRKLVRYVQSCEVTSVVGGRLMKGAHGTQIVIDAVAGAASQGTPATVKRYEIQSEDDNTVSCKLWDGSDGVGDAVNIAKPWNLRLAQKPTGGTGTHTIDRPYTAGEIILATEPDSGTGLTGVTLQDLNIDAREWSYELVWCEDGDAYKGRAKIRGVSAV